MESSPIVDLGVLPATAEIDRKRFWSRYCQVVQAALSACVGTDLRLLKETALRIWPHFIRPVLDGKHQLTDFRNIYLDNEALFTSEFAVKDRLIDGIIDDESFGPTNARNVKLGLPADQSVVTPSSRYELPIQSKYLLIAAYLASYNPPRFDIRFFSKAKEARAKRRDTGRRKRLKIDPRSLAAPAFDLERFLAIYRAISNQNADDDSLSTVDVFVQISTLQTLRLVLRTDSDPLDSRTKWKVNASWDQVAQIAREVDFPIEDYIV
jgi:origin recognition complex subunit 5